MENENTNNKRKIDNKNDRQPPFHFTEREQKKDPPTPRGGRGACVCVCVWIITYLLSDVVFVMVSAEVKLRTGAPTIRIGNRYLRAPNSEPAAPRSQGPAGHPPPPLTFNVGCDS